MFSRTTTKSMSAGPLSLSGVSTPGVELHGAEIDVEVELEAEPEQDALLEDAGLHVGVADRAEEDRVEPRRSSTALSGSTSPVRR